MKSSIDRETWTNRANPVRARGSWSWCSRPSPRACWPSPRTPTTAKPRRRSPAHPPCPFPHSRRPSPRSRPTRSTASGRSSRRRPKWMRNPRAPRCRKRSRASRRCRPRSSRRRRAPRMHRRLRRRRRIPHWTTVRRLIPPLQRVIPPPIAIRHAPEPRRLHPRRSVSRALPSVPPSRRSTSMSACVSEARETTARSARATRAPHRPRRAWHPGRPPPPRAQRPRLPPRRRRPPSPRRRGTGTGTACRLPRYLQYHRMDLRTDRCQRTGRGYGTVERIQRSIFRAIPGSISKSMRTSPFASPAPEATGR